MDWNESGAGGCVRDFDSALVGDADGDSDVAMSFGSFAVRLADKKNPGADTQRARYRSPGLFTNQTGQVKEGRLICC